MEATLSWETGQAIGAYRIQECLPDLGGRARYRVSAPDGQDRLLTLVGPTVQAPDRREKLLARVRRTLSWQHEETILFPQDFVFAGELFGFVSALPSSRPLRDALASEEVSLAQCLAWLRRVCDAMINLHDARQPLYLRALPMDNLRVRSNGVLEILGFELNGDLKLEFVPFGDVLPAPGELSAVQGDLWHLGYWFQACLECASASVRREYRDDSGLRALLESLLAGSEGITSAAVFRSRLDIQLRPVIPLGTARLEEAEKHLTEAAREVWQVPGDGYRRWLVLSILALILTLTLMNAFFPLHP